MPRVVLGFRARWPLGETMRFERAHHPALRMSLADKRATLAAPGALAVFLYDARRRALIGETYGVPARAAVADRGEPGAADVAPFVRRRALYVLSTTILPAYQGRGYGTVLKAYLLGRAVQAGYRVAIGHAREGASTALNVKFGAALGTRHPDWYGTGAAYRFYVTRLG